MNNHISSTDVHLLVAPYALDALDAHERNRFEDHLEHCETCRIELDEFTSTALRLGEAESAAPPAELRERILAAVATTTQDRPVVTSLVERSRLRRTLPRLAVAASFLVAAAGVTGYVVEHDRAADLQVQTQQVSTVMGADDVAITEGRVSTGGSVRMMASPSQDAAVVVGAQLTPLDDDHTYQLWALHDGKATSAGLLGPSSGMVFVAGIDGAEGFAVTVEPEGGSESPTTEPVVEMDA